MRPLNNTPKKALRIQKWVFALMFWGLTLLLFGAKLWIIYNFGNATPYWDQWDAEAMHLFKPYLDGTLNLRMLLENHNEHRIFLSRLFTLGLLELNGLNWNPLFEMVMNVVLHVGALVMIIFLIGKSINKAFLSLLVSFAILLFVIPYGWENTVIGIDSHTPFVFIFAILGIWCFATGEPFDLKWFVGIACIFLGLLSMAPGIIAGLAASALALAKYFFAKDKNRKHLYSFFALTLVFLICFLLTPRLPELEPLRPKSPYDFYIALIQPLAWPLPIGIIGVLIRNSPAIIFLAWIIKIQPTSKDNLWFLVGMIFWSMILALAMSTARGTEGLASRYLDFVALSIITLFGVLLVVIDNKLGLVKRWPIGYPTTWVTLLILGLCIGGPQHSDSNMAIRKASQLLQEQNTKNYLKTNDDKFLDISKIDGQLFPIPYPEPARLKEILSYPEIRRLLPANINEFGNTGRFDKLVNSTLASYHIFIFFGIGFLLLSVAINVFAGQVQQK